VNIEKRHSPQRRKVRKGKLRLKDKRRKEKLTTENHRGNKRYEEKSAVSSISH